MQWLRSALVRLLRKVDETGCVERQ